MQEFANEFVSAKKKWEEGEEGGKASVALNLTGLEEWADQQRGVERDVESEDENESEHESENESEDDSEDEDESEDESEDEDESESESESSTQRDEVQNIVDNDENEPLKSHGKKATLLDEQDIIIRMPVSSSGSSNENEMVSFNTESYKDDGRIPNHLLPKAPIHKSICRSLSTLKEENQDRNILYQIDQTSVQQSSSSAFSSKFLADNLQRMSINNDCQEISNTVDSSSSRSDGITEKNDFLNNSDDKKNNHDSSFSAMSTKKSSIPNRVDWNKTYDNLGNTMKPSITVISSYDNDVEGSIPVKITENEKDVKSTSERITTDPISKKSKIEELTNFVGEEIATKKS